jgi:hypothetical protein
MNDEKTAPSEDRQRALHEFDRFCRFIDGLHMNATFVENDFMHKSVQKLIRTALSTPRPPMIEGLREAVEESEQWNTILREDADAIIKAARWVLDNMEE